jgi:hypothetical protein
LADAKAASDKALADVKVASEKALLDVKAEVAALTKALASLKKAYNAMAKKFKFPAVK